MRKKALVLNYSIIAMMMIAPMFWYSELPETMPIHFDISGAPDRFADKTMALLLLPAIGLVLSLYLPIFIRLSPKGYQLEESQTLVAKFVTVLLLFFAILHFGILGASLYPSEVSVQRVISVALGGLTMALGNYLHKSEKNFFIGIRTPWALVSDENWRATHRFAGKLLFGLGFVSLLISWFIPNPAVPGVALLFGCLLPYFYSFKKAQKKI